MIIGNYPNLRLRRSRKHDWSRRLIQENSLSTSDFILPIFLIDGKNTKQSIKKIGKIKSLVLKVFSWINFLDQDSFLLRLNLKLGYFPVIMF